MLKIWGRTSSINVQKVLWLVEELGLRYRLTELGGRFGGLDSAAFLALNPHGLVPVIEDDDTVVWESHAILRYLAARSHNSAFWPADPAARAQADPWIDWAQTTFQPDFHTGVFWGFYRTPEAERDKATVAAKVALSACHILLLDRVLAGRAYLLGNQLSLADIPLGTLLYRYFNLEIDRPEAPNVAAWYGRLCQRPGYRSQIMRQFDEFYGRLAF